MKDQQIVKKLQLLKNIQPAQYTLKSIKRQVDQRIAKEKAKSHLKMQTNSDYFSLLREKYGAIFYAGIFAFSLAIFLFVTVIFFPNLTHAVVFYGKLTLARNQYEKARIALVDIKSRFPQNKTIYVNSGDLAYSLILTKTELDRLKLIGEKGKYTAQQCNQIYKDYLIYLENKEKVISPHNVLLRSEINTMEEQAEKKLHMYNSL